MTWHPPLGTAQIVWGCMQHCVERRGNALGTGKGYHCQLLWWCYVCTFADFGEFFILSNCTLIFIKMTSFCLDRALLLFFFFYKIKWWSRNGISQCILHKVCVPEDVKESHVVLHSQWLFFFWDSQCSQPVKVLRIQQ